MLVGGELVAELVRDGYLERAADPTDGRVRLVRPTAQGRRELGRTADHLRDLRDRWQRELSAMPVEQVLDALETLIGICEADAHRPDTPERGPTSA